MEKRSSGTLLSFPNGHYRELLSVLWLILIATCWSTAVATTEASTAAPSPHAVELQARAATVLEGLKAVESYYETTVKPIEHFVYRANPDSSLAREIAWGIVTESRRHGIPTDVALGILLVENPDFEPTARSSAGAVGLAQVMPLHAGKWRGCGKNLEHIRTNLCTGFSVFKALLKKYQSVDRALLAYNGCVSAPGCSAYPSWVKQRLGQARLALWNNEIK